jgi:hypothetical protein
LTADHVVPLEVARRNEESYDDPSSITEFVEFPGRPHFPGGPAWEDVADYALAWAVERRHVTCRRRRLPGERGIAMTFEELVLAASVVFAGLWSGLLGTLTTILHPSRR